MFTTIHLFIFEKINTRLKWWPMLTWNNIRQVHHKSFSQTDLNWTRSGSNSQDPDCKVPSHLLYLAWWLSPSPATEDCPPWLLQPPTPVHHLSLSSQNVYVAKYMLEHLEGGTGKHLLICFISQFDFSDTYMLVITTNMVSKWIFIIENDPENLKH